jgi:transposase
LRPGVTSQMTEENKALRKEIAELRRANEILKAAAIFFGAELDRPGRR